MTWFKNAHPRARTEHRCSDCGRTIRPGEVYRRGAGFDGGTAWTWKDCRHCEYALHQYDLAWDGEYNADHFYEWATDGARDVQEARDQAGYLHRWTTRGGNLWPIPTDDEPGRRDWGS